MSIKNIFNTNNGTYSSTSQNVVPYKVFHDPKKQLLTPDNKNAYDICCPKTNCKCLLLRANIATWVDLPKELLELPSNLKSLASDKSTNDHNDNELSSDSDSPLQGYWQINNMLEFENIIFSKTVEETGIKYLFCANCINCDLEPLGIHDTNENNSNDDDLIQEAGIFLLATHKGSYDIGEDVISKK
nr:1028_t:CDS:2 [Entrophospora candida]CAG8599888.1 13911_t:CDS:2 [Entrophospora candida]